MKAQRFTMLAATLVLAATFTCITAGEAAARTTTLIGHGFGTGATLPIAQNAAKNDLIGSYFGCQLPPLLIDSGQNPNGTWYAEVASNCTGYR